MSVRRATPADIERLVDLNMEVHDLHVDHLPDFFKSARREDLAVFFQEMLASETARVFVACRDQQVVGYMLLVIRERLENPVVHARRLLYIEQIGVAQAHRRQGHATDLVSTARAVARAHGLGCIELDTWGFNGQAHAFFRAQGFETRSIKLGMSV